MTKLEKALYSKWISRFGRTRVKDLAEGLDTGKSIADRARAIVESRTEEELRALILEGFNGFFHQTVYLRKLAKAKQSVEGVKEIPIRKAIHSVVLEEMTPNVTDTEVRCLLMVTHPLEFLQKEGPTVSENIPFPVALGIAKSNFTVQVLTMQITVETWGKMLEREKELRRLLTPVRADELHDQALNFLRESKVDVGEYVDYSDAAIRLLKRNRVKTYSGTFEIGTVGSTKHDTIRGMAKRPLRDSMKEKFQELVSAKRITNAEIELARDYLGLKAGSRVALYPTVGKIAFRSRLQGCDPDEFVKAMAKH